MITFQVLMFSDDGRTSRCNELAAADIDHAAAAAVDSCPPGFFVAGVWQKLDDIIIGWNRD